MGSEESRRVYDKLLRKPLSVLSRYFVSIDELDGYDSTPTKAYFSVLDDRIHIGGKYHARTIEPSKIDKEIAIKVDVIASPMRSGGVAERLLPTARIDTGIERLWLTEQQTGCTVLILDWGSEELSMIHLQPDADTDFRWISQLLMYSDTFKAGYKNLWLKRESTEIVGKSGSGATPQRYIMVQSGFDTMRTYRTQLLGVNTADGWQFFKQSYQRAGHGAYTNLTLTQLTWTAWQPWVPYWTQ